MIRRIHQLRRVGIFGDCTRDGPEWKPLTLVYGENGTGKSTLTSLFRAVEQLDSDSLLRRKRMGCSEPVEFAFEAEGGETWGFSEGAWFGKRPQLRIFDDHFVRSNVYVGAEVTVDNRRNLVNLALGTRHVRLVAEADDALASREEAVLSRKNVEDAVSADHGEIGFEEFANLIPRLDIDSALQDISERATQMQRRSEILDLPRPCLPASLVIETEEFLNVLSERIDFHSSLTEHALDHMERITGDRAQIVQWLETGVGLATESYCPLCGASVDTSSSIDALRTFFSGAYRRASQRLADETEAVLRAISNDAVNRLQISHERAVANVNRWRDFVDIPAIPALDFDELKDQVMALRDLVEEARRCRLAALDTALDTESLRAAMTTRIIDIKARCAPQRDAIAAADALIDAYRNRLADETEESVAHQKTLLELMKHRARADVDARVREVQIAREREKEAQDRLKRARTNLKNAVRAELSWFESDINDKLEAFGVSFRVREMKQNFIGKRPIGTYQLELLGECVPINGRDGRFHEALSEGDKRALGLALFLTLAYRDPNVGKQIVIIDDPMTSLDAGRRNATVAELVKLRKRVGQLIVFAHDAYFLRDLLSGLNQPSRATLSIRRGSDGSFIAVVDFDELVDTEYRKRLLVLENFLQSGEGRDGAAAALRPAVEEALRRWFPLDFKSKDMLAAMCEKIRKAAKDSRIAVLAPDVEILDRIRIVGNPPHHGGGDGHDPTPISDQELCSHVKKALNIIYRDKRLLGV